MKLSILWGLATTISSIKAATLNVGSGKTYATITAAYNAASAGDTIYVSILTRGLIFTVHGSVLIET
ncbi:hypothetical protein ACEPPN_017668 [Leptodophora sp. 'Broadleaf-Isolate-01']